jgi:hypothetical protein
MTASGAQSSTSTLVHPPASRSSFDRSDLVIADDGGAGRAVGVGPGEAVVRHRDRNVCIIAAATDSGPDRAL